MISNNFKYQSIGRNHDPDYDYDYGDTRSRRRATSNFTLRSSPYNPIVLNGHQQCRNEQVNNVRIPAAMREEFGLPTRTVSTYDHLLLSLQSPLPNEQDMAICVCTLLSNETKYVLRFAKCPAILNLLLAHAGIYDHCGLRMLIEETYSDARNMKFSDFWNEVVQNDIKPFLCESYVKRVQKSRGLSTEESTDNSVDEGHYNVEINEMYDEEERFGEPTLDSDMTSRPSTPEPEPKSCLKKSNVLAEVDKEIEVDLELITCCSICPCNSGQRGNELFSDDGDKSGSNKGNPVPPSLAGSPASDDKVGRRIHQITCILRNLSIEEDNAIVMAENPNLLRYLLISANCSWGNLRQLSFDMLGSIAGHIKLKDPAKDPLSAMLLSLVTSGLFSADRFKVLRSLETIRDLTKTERNEKILVDHMENNVYQRLCELLTVCDIMLLIYTLECMLAVTGIGEAVCSELVRVKGSVATLFSLVTVEAQSYGRKGCVLMRVVEFGSQSAPQCVQNQQPVTTPSSQLPPATPTVNSIQAIGLRTVSGHTGVPLAEKLTGTPPVVVDANPPTSLMGHLQERNCVKQSAELPNHIHKNKIEQPLAHQKPICQPGYPPNAAFDAVKRHALQHTDMKEITDEKEGPVTKSIRLTSSLILRNLVNFSPLGRRMIGAYESQLSAIAMSNVESSRTLAQLLHDISESEPVLNGQL